MRCPDANDMAAYLDGLMDPRERAVLEEHFRHCAKCGEAGGELAALLCLPPMEAERVVIDAGKSLIPAAGAQESPCRPVMHAPIGLACQGVRRTKVASLRSTDPRRTSAEMNRTDGLLRILHIAPLKCSRKRAG